MGFNSQNGFWKLASACWTEGHTDHLKQRLNGMAPIGDEGSDQAAGTLSRRYGVGLNGGGQTLVSMEDGLKAQGQRITSYVKVCYRSGFRVREVEDDPVMDNLRTVEIGGESQPLQHLNKKAQSIKQKLKTNVIKKKNKKKRTTILSGNEDLTLSVQEPLLSVKLETNI
ncbi:hypothetical protein NE237_009746 [Protea cynaroides]|uniref:Uncharacterized protein n=1 Tax=Protea cynaroides TaxID=273540 RepID=A0A9Q0KZ81_9MAGN|nr:hypothetical protein NE237_009746 [Protea cynaroides]